MLFVFSLVLSIILALYNFDIVQAPFNLIDRRLIETGWLEKLNMSNIEVHCRSCFLQGLLLMDREKLMPTALNNGIAVPHTREVLLNRTTDIVVMVSPSQPIDWGALDKKPVHARIVS